jgi:hypothetical protein
LKKETLDKSVDQFSMWFAKDPDVKGGSLLVMAWENTKYSVPFTLAK